MSKRPHEIAGETEHSHQSAFIQWCRVAAWWGVEESMKWVAGLDLPPKPEKPIIESLLWIHAIPNGGARGDNARSAKIRGAQLKAEGVTKGVFDIFYPFPSSGLHGLYIEFKKPSMKPKTLNSKGGLGDEQIKFMNYLSRNNYGKMVVYNWEEAVETILFYLQHFEGSLI